MRKAINISALVLLIWLIVDALHIPEALISFLLVGEIPGVKTNLSPTLMLAIMTTSTGLVLFEIASHRYSNVRQFRQQILSLIFNKSQKTSSTKS